MTPDDLSLRTAVAYAMRDVRVGGKRLAEDDRVALAAAVAAYFNRCGWTVQTSEKPLGPDVVYGPSVAEVSRRE